MTAVRVGLFVAAAAVLVALTPGDSGRMQWCIAASVVLLFALMSLDCTVSTHCSGAGDNDPLRLAALGQYEEMKVWL